MEIFIYLAIMIVSAYAVTALAPKPEKPAPASISDFSMPTAEEGRAIPVVFGTCKITGPNVIWYGNLRTKPIRTKSGK